MCVRIGVLKSEHEKRTVLIHSHPLPFLNGGVLSTTNANTRPLHSTQHILQHFLWGVLLLKLERGAGATDNCFAMENQATTPNMSTLSQ